MSVHLEDEKSAAPDSLALHAAYRGKVQIMPKCPLRDLGDFAIWYTPGVAEPCRAIQADRERVYDYTNRGNLVAVVSDGSRVLGLGNIGPEAGLPVMEGKALLFKHLGGVDAVALCLRTGSPEELITAVKAIEPSFGAINLEDIAQPHCFTVLDRLRRELSIPVWHDDQQGTATAVLAGLTGAFKLVKKELSSVTIVLVGVGAANVATYRLLVSAGADPARIRACDSKGLLHRGRADIESQQDLFPDKWRICRESNLPAITGGIAEALSGADVCLAFSRSGPEVIRPASIVAMAKDAIVFACANPVPEIWPAEAVAAGARIVATGRSDFPNQVNNALVFPGLFRGVLDSRARRITEGMAIAAAMELARMAEEAELSFDHILPQIDDPRVAPRIAAAVGECAQQEGMASLGLSRDDLLSQAKQRIEAVHVAEKALCDAGLL
jgi:malate dehydrogenase (oxaloacetate-decarboxylating)